MKVISLSEEQFKWLRKKNLDEKWIAIRIYSQPEETMKMSRRFNEQFDDILLTYFTDVKSPVESDGKLYKPFNEVNYESILAFVKKHIDADILYVHCHAGICRSPGVAVGLEKQFDCITAQHGLNNEMDVFPYPNVVSWF